MVSLWRTLCCALALAGAVALSACGDDDSGTPSPGGPGGTPSGTGGGTPPPSSNDCVNGFGGDLPLTFNPLYSAYGGTTTYQVPIKVDVPSPPTDVTWTFDPPDAVTYELRDDLGPGVWVLTTQQAGTVQIKAEAGSLYGCALLEVSPATDEQVTVGEMRYNNNNTIPPFDPSMLPRLEDGGLDFDSLQEEAGDFLANMDTWSCANCHGENAVMIGVEHTPLQTGGYSDAELIQIISMGVKPPGAVYSNPFFQLSYSSFHTWTATPEEVQALVLYLRSLAPKSQGALDFPDFGGFGGGGGFGDDGPPAP